MANIQKVSKEADIRPLKSRDTDYMVGCGGGLWLRIRKTREAGAPGRKTFIIRRMEAGKTKIITLGDWPTLSLDVARKLVVNTVTPGAETVQDLLVSYRTKVIDRHARPDQFNAYEKRIRAALGRVRVAEVKAKQLAQLVGKHRDTPRAADSLRGHLRAMFALAMEEGLVDHNPALVIGARVTGYKYEPRTRILTDEEILELWSWTGKKAALLRFLLLSGLRISEAQTGGKQDGDFWRLPTSKNGKPHWVYLVDTAKAQLSEPFDTSNTNVQAWLRRKQKFSPEAWTAHDLRRTFATLAMGAGVLPHVVEKTLNHALEGMLRIYSQADLTEERIEAAKTVEKVVLKIVSKTAA